MSLIDGVEVHARSDDGRLVVVVEDTTDRRASDIIMDLHQLSGVVSLTLNYHHFEDPSTAQSGLVGRNPAGDQTNDRI